MTNKKKQHYFLEGGGKMGKLIREKDWSKTPLGDPSTWPQSLCTMVSVMLENPFSMYIAWGKEYTQIYNDGYRPILGETKHPQALGSSTKDSFPEIWHIIERMFDDVMKGKPVGLSDFVVPLNRNGYIENCSFDFAYSPIRMENGEVGGVLATVIETTHKRKNEDALKQHDNQLDIAIENGNSDSVNKNNVITKRITNDILKEWFGMSYNKESEQSIRTLIENAPFPIGVFTGNEMRITLANKSITDTWGKGDDVVGKLYSDILPELENQQIFNQIREVYTTGIPFHAKNQKVHLFKDGVLKRYYFNYNFTPLFDSSNQVYGVMNTAAEVTELNEAKEKVDAALKEIELFKFMADTAADPFILMDEQGNFLYLNNKALQKWGYTYEEMAHLKVPDLDPIYNNEKFIEVFHRCQVENIPPFETLHKNKQGLIYPVEISMGCVHYNQKPLMFAIARDITERKEAQQDILNAFKKIEESEKRFRNSVKQAPLGIAIFRGDDYIAEMANENYLLLVDRTEDDFIGNPLFASIPEVEELVAPLFHDVKTTGNAFYSAELPAKLKRYGKMEKAFFNLVYHPLKEENGDISGIMVIATEVTETVKAKHLLEESEKHFRNMVMQSPISMTILKGKDHIIESANTAMLENVWHKKEADVMGKSILEVFPELKDQKYPELLKEVFRLGKRHSEKESLAYVNGDDGLKKFYLDFEYAPLFETDGAVSGIMITVNDVTDKVEARKKVEDSEERSRLAVEATELATWELDLQNRNIIHSPRLAVIFGHDEHAIITHEQMRSQIHPEDIHNVVEKAFDKAMITGVYSYEARLIKLDKSIRWIRTQGKVFFDKNNTPIKKIGTLLDITEEKNYQQVLQESETKFRLLADSMPQHIWTADPQGNLNYFNQSVFDFTGLTLKKILKDGWLQIVHPDDQQKNIEEWTQSIATGKDFLLEHRFRKYDGEYRWQLSRAIAQKDAEGNIAMWVGTSTDIEDQKKFTNELEVKVAQRTKELNQKNLDLEEMNKELQSFAYISSHDLQEPLRKIQTFASQITERESVNLSSYGIDKFERMQRAAHRMQTLIQDLLAYSRTSTLEKNFEVTDLKAIIEEIKDDLKDDLQLKKATIEIGEMCDVKVIPFQFRQILYNLFSNALKFSSEERTPIIKIDCKNGKGIDFNNKKLINDTNYTQITVVDNGIGFEQEYSEKIFQVFQRLHGKDEYIGTGIGLAIVKKIIENHNGVIVANGKVNEGATFDIYIPS